MNVSDFRDLISSLYTKISTDWHACVNDEERVRNMTASINAAQELEAADCKRATPADELSRERALEAFGAAVNERFHYWMTARVKAGHLNAAQARQVIHLNRTGNLSQSIH